MLTVEAQKIPYVRGFLFNLLHVEEYAKTCNTQSPADITLKNSTHVHARAHTCLKPLRGRYSTPRAEEHILIDAVLPGPCQARYLECVCEC